MRLSVRRTRQKVRSTLSGANRPLKVVAQCRIMSQDAQGNMCYNVNCQRRMRTHDATQHQRNYPRVTYPLAEPITQDRSAGKLVTVYDMIGGDSFSTKQEIICTPPLSNTLQPSSRDSFSVPPSHPLDSLTGTNRTLKSCHTMTHNVARRPRQYTLPSANEPQKLSPNVTKSRETDESIRAIL